MIEMPAVGGYVLLGISNRYFEVVQKFYYLFVFGDSSKSQLDELIAFE